MAGIQFVYFDLDDTLLDHKKAQNLALVDLHSCTPALADLDLDQVRASYATVNSRVWREYSEGTRDKEGTRNGRFRLLFEALGLEADATLAADQYLEAYENHWSYVQGAWPAYRQIASHLPTGLLTNGFAETQRLKLARFPRLSETLQSIVISEEEGVLKPALSLFQAATDRAGVPADSIAYVGDSMQSDILGGLAAGWQVFWYTQDPSGAPENVPCFSDWSRLPALLGL